MFGNLGQMMGLLRNVGAIKQGVQEMNERLQALRLVGEAGGGQVQATMDGRGEVLGVKIDPALVQGGDVELLEELVAAAFRDAAQRVKDAAQQEMQGLAGGLGLPGMDQLLGGGGPQ